MLSLSFQLLKSFPAKPADYVKEDLEALARFTLLSEKVSGEARVTLDLTNPKRIQTLNRRYRGVDRDTDVISFRYDTGPGPALTRRRPERGGLEGDIAINIPRARMQAKKMRHPTRREVRLLLIHGILHLLGYTDYEPGPRRIMFRRQNQLLRKWER